MNSETILCVYCNKNLATTDDHVPPKSFFPKPRPSNLITVPSCKSCNQDAGKDEEFFLATFMFSFAGNSDAGKRLWAEKLHRMYDKNLGLKRKIASALKRTDFFTPAGIFLGKGFTIQTDEERFAKVTNKIVKGLYYHEYKESLPPSVEMTCLFLQTEAHFASARKHDHELRYGSSKWPSLFEYRFNRVADDVTASMWLLLFYNFATFWILTCEKSKYETLRKKANN